MTLIKKSMIGIINPKYSTFLFYTFFIQSSKNAYVFFKFIDHSNYASYQSAGNCVIFHAWKNVNTELYYGMNNIFFTFYCIYTIFKLRTQTFFSSFLSWYKLRDLDVLLIVFSYKLYWGMSELVNSCNLNILKLLCCFLFQQVFV